MIHQEQKTNSTLGSYPSVSVTFMTTLALLVAGLFGLVLLHTTQLTNVIKENINVQVYLHKNASEDESIKLRQALSNKDFVLKKDGYACIKFISKEEAAQTFTEATGEAFLQVLDENPLRDVYIVSIAADHQHHLQRIKQELESMSGVFEVDYVPGFASAASRNLSKISTALACCAVMLFMVVVALINSTIRIALYSQRFLIRSMSLVGATAMFIQRPFLVRAVFIGLMASTIANSLLLLALHYANHKIEALISLQDPIQIFSLFGGLTLLGIVISLSGTYYTVNRYLNMSLDDLHKHE